MEYDLVNAVTRTIMLAPQPIAANTNTSVIDLQPYHGKLSVQLNVGTNTAGTSPTLTVYLFDSADNSNWNTCNINSSSLTAPASSAQLAIDTRSVRRYLMGTISVGGTNSPNIPLSIEIDGQLKNNPTAA